MNASGWKRIFSGKKINRERHVYEFNPTDMLVPVVHFSVQISSMFAGSFCLIQTMLANFDDALRICKYLYITAMCRLNQ